MSLINFNDRFAIFGARGMAGSAICRALDRAGYNQQLKPSRQELDLLETKLGEAHAAMTTSKGETKEPPPTGSKRRWTLSSKRRNRRCC